MQRKPQHGFVAFHQLIRIIRVRAIRILPRTVLCTGIRSGIEVGCQPSQHFGTPPSAPSTWDTILTYMRTIFTLYTRCIVYRLYTPHTLLPYIDNLYNSIHIMHYIQHMHCIHVPDTIRYTDIRYSSIFPLFTLYIFYVSTIY